MRVLTAGTGERVGDFSFTVPGELVTVAVMCGTDVRGEDLCGCGRSWAGVTSRKATTVAVVADLSLDHDTYVQVQEDAARVAGWLPGTGMEFAADLLDLASQHDIGTRVRRNVDDVEVES